MRRWGAAVVLALVLLLAHAGPVGLLLNQAAYLSGPGDRLAVVFPPGVSSPDAVGRLGASGTMLTDAVGIPWYYRVRVVDERAARRLSGQAWVIKIPGPPSFAGCFAPPASPYRG